MQWLIFKCKQPKKGKGDEQKDYLPINGHHNVPIARQGSAFRGSDESRLNSNRGNFLCPVDLLSQNYTVLKLQLDVIKEKQASKQRPQVFFLSNRTQNDRLKAFGFYVKRVIQKEVMEASLFSILLDETTVVLHIEQASFVVHYVQDMTIKEYFIALCDFQTTTGKVLEKLVILEENQLRVEDICGQGTTGQSRVQTQNEMALYVHYHVYCLNLVLMESAKSSIHFVDFFSH